MEEKPTDKEFEEILESIDRVARLERLSERLTDKMDSLVRLKIENAPKEIIENSFIDFSISKNAFVEAMGCRKEPDVIKDGVFRFQFIQGTKNESLLNKVGMVGHILSLHDGHTHVMRTNHPIHHAKMNSHLLCHHICTSYQRFVHNPSQFELHVHNQVPTSQPLYKVYPQ